MSRSIYALIVGIDHYKSPGITPLKGCVNDVIAIDEFLRKRVASNGDNLYIKKLINHEATRQAIITTFREHLGQAKNNDIALFYYSGHGSQEVAAQEFWYLEPDHLNETLVCWDSRTDDVWDLADKEIAKLIAEVSQNNPHIVLIFDSCHSGGGTRGEKNYIGVRSIENDLRERPLSSFIFSEEEINNLRSGSFSLPKGEYIFLAACRDNEKAKEHCTLNQRRGAFSYFLLDSLLHNSSLTYRDLFKRTNALVRSFYPKQSPQIEATNLSYLDQPFLGGAIVKKHLYFTVIYEGFNGWSIDGGAVHGIIYSNRTEKTRLAIFPIDVVDTNQLQNAIAVAEITEVLPQLSKINISGEREELNPQLIYKAVITSQPLSPLKVYLEGKESGINFARQAIQKASFGASPSLYIYEVSDYIDADFELSALDDEYTIFRVSDRRQIIYPIPGFTLESAQQAIQALEHIARWINIATLSSPANSLIQANAVLMQVYQQNLEIQDYQISLQYEVYEDKLRPPAIRIKLTNTSNKTLYCVLLNLTERYAVEAIPFAGDQTGIWLEPGQEAWAFEGKNICISIPQNILKQKIKEYKDILKLIVSTNEFDGKLLKQDSIETIYTRSLNNVNLQPRAIVSCENESQNPETWNDWFTSEIMITTTAPQRINFPKPSHYEKPIQKLDASDSSKASSKNVVHVNLFKKSKTLMFLLLALTAVFLMSSLIGWQKSKDKQKTSYYFSYKDLEKTKDIQTHISTFDQT
ncbi:caspase family protein [Aetokthonos hydrillicola Thurmond2011]|jgi:hypothetical protein|uniref:Caspase family protein n=1 Tax=Aetokthonos hydrillicola Thurmond2011 TaxID=2712845 RepID=A0AAP5I7Q1_9CYAN|nr:caspase family protein [Aetokthonos hydrillicola]MBO3463512.1 caspase family protein [Aetokthonos hydrillicola CCALA 1050]MBW4588600.1 caspase family protein [Aetokthonos hydrillicola CCALA 1050]MDR9896275.1 caspase family protein [Aetokthonos hydrillicola Thurmond2011]